MKKDLEGIKKEIEQALIPFLKHSKQLKILEKYILKQIVRGRDIEDILYQIIGCYSLGIKTKEIIEYLHYNTLLDWQHPIYEPFRQQQDEEDRFLESPIEVEEGVMECGKCNSKYTFSYQKQTRRADEGTTVFSTCVSCGNKWKT